MLRGQDVYSIGELRREGLSIQAISEATGWDRKTVRKYLLQPDDAPAYSPRDSGPGKLEGFKSFLEERLEAGVWNAQVLLRELRQRGYEGGYTILTDWLRPLRQSARVAAVRRFETPAGRQAQVDWGHLGYLDQARLWGFTFTLGRSRAMMASGALDQKLGTLLRMHEEAFQQLGGVPDEILYDRMRTVWEGTDERGEILWQPTFLDFARYWGFTPRLCRPYRAQTKGKVESGVKYIRRNFVCGLLGEEPGNLDEFLCRLRAWVWEVANRRVHGTTHEVIYDSWQAEKPNLHAIDGRPPYAYVEEEQRQVARDAYISWQGSRYSVPWEYAGRQVWVQPRENSIEVRCGAQRIARHAVAGRKHEVITVAEHHRGIPLGDKHRGGKILVHIQESAPIVERRSLAVYESFAGGAL